MAVFGAIGRLGFSTKVAVLLSIRAVGALLSHITDCDEVFNYWEPLHYLVHGTGLQTWEYSPDYGLRSYFYLLPHAVPAVTFKLAGISKPLAFLATRALLGSVSAVCESWLCEAVRLAGRSGGKGTGVFGQADIADSTAGVTFVFLALSTGMFHASVALLPSTTAMYFTMIATASWLRGHDLTAIFAVAATTLCVWPFSGAVGITIAVDIVLRRARIFFFIKSCVLALIAILPISVAIDSLFYGKLVFPALNIVMYNVLSGSTSSELYGTEPWTFYFFNGFLNLNVAFVLALVGPLVALVVAPDMKAFWTLVPMVVWFCIFFPQAHKEERFLFPVYPLICLSGAYSLVVLENRVSKALPKPLNSLIKLGSKIAVIGFIVVSMSRTVAMYKGYHAPMKVYAEVSKLTPTSPARLCVGKEWYRFPSAFFLPGGDALSIEFIKSGYDGLLPKPFASINGTSAVPTHMNNMNREEPTRYVDPSTCDFIVDLAMPANEVEANYKESNEWEDVVCYPFLDPARSHALLRAFYIPGLSDSRTKYNDYCLHRRVRS